LTADTESGLYLDENSFMCLPVKKQLCVLYQNQVEVLNIIKSYKLTQKIQYAWLTALTGIGIWIINIIVK